MPSSPTCRPLVAVSPSTSATRSAVDRGSDGRVGVQGPVELGEHTSVVAVMGECHLDLSQAEIDGPDIVITALGIMGSIEIVTPEGIDVDLTGMSIMGRRSLQVHDTPVLRGSPRILIRAFPIMGEVKVTTRTASSGQQRPALR